MTQPDKSSNHVPLESSIPEGGASLESILCTEELQRRPSRPPDYAKENSALVALVSALADSPSTILQTLANTILEITQSDSAGLSLLTKEDGGKRFHWAAIAGMWNPHVGGGTPRNFGPCGDVLDRNTPMLFTHWERRYPYLSCAVPLAEEGLLVPFYVGGKAVGTIWAIMHSDRRQFDAEHNRVMASLGKFASSAYQAVAHIEDLKIQVAEREKAEAEVRKLASGLEAKIRRLVDANIMGIFIWNLEGKIVEANEAFLNMVQYGREELASGRMRWTDLTPAEWRDRDARALTELTKVGTVQPYEKEFFRKNGGRVPVLAGGALFEESGHEGVAFVLDLSEQKRAEEALRQSEQRWRTAFENSAIGIMMRDREGRYIAANSVFQNMLGYTESELCQLNFMDVTYEEDRKANLELVGQIWEGRRQHYQIEKRYRRKDGALLWVRNNVALVPGTRDVAPFLFAVVEDITQRKQEESARRYSEEKYRVVVDTADDAVVTADESGAIQFANPATMRVFGYDPAELIGKPLTVLMPEFMRKLHENGFRRYLTTGQRHVNWRSNEFTGLRKNGQEFPVEVSFGELTMNSHRVFTGFIRDISERKQAEEQRERLRQALADLAHINRVTTMGQLTASLAHEIKQPIAAALTNAETCLDWLACARPGITEAQEAASRLIRDVTRASNIISRMGSLHKKGVPQRKWVNLNELIQEMIALLHGEAARYSISLHRELADGLPKIIADRVGLQQVLMNLMLNGIEAMKDMGTPGSLTISSKRNGDDQLLVSVADTGIGLLPENAEQIFSAFFTSKAQGTGMGLTISRSIIESHGGRLWAAPNRGPGATFQFVLPVKVTATSVIQPAPSRT